MKNRGGELLIPDPKFCQCHFLGSWPLKMNDRVVFKRYWFRPRHSSRYVWWIVGTDGNGRVGKWPLAFFKGFDLLGEV